MIKDARFHFDNLAKHAIEWFEAEEALWDGWHHRRREGEHYEVLGRTEDGRYLQLMVTLQPDCLWVFHGRDMTPSEKKRYARK